MIGEKIKELRINNKMTQKDLAERLYVTAQAVSRWENGEVEPSLSTLVEIAKIFNVSTDELLNINVSREEKAPEVVVQKEIVYAEAPKQHLALCESCNKPIYDTREMVRVIKKTGDSKIICKACREKDLQQEKIKKERKLKEDIEKGKQRRSRSFIIGGLVSIIPLVYAISSLGDGIGEFIIGIILTYMTFAFISTLILNNTFINDLFLDICGWGMVTFPGLIWEFSLDGFLWLIGMKLLFWLLGILLGLLCCVVAIIISSVLSVFVYPHALKKSINQPSYANA